MASYKELQQNLVLGQENKVEELISSLLDSGNNPREIMEEGLMRGMSVVGQKMKAGEMFLPEVLLSAQIVRKCMEVLQPLIVGETLSTALAGKVVIGTVQGDVHSIGKDIVALMLQSAGFTVVNLGADVPPEKFVQAVHQEQPYIIGLSALVTTTMPRMRDVIEALRRSNLREKVRVMVGGAPVTQGFADSIGADGYAPDAISTVDKAKQMMGQP